MLLQVLLLAAVVSFALAYFEDGSEEEGFRAYIEPAVILLILALNAFVGVWQESNAEAALEALKEMQPEFAMVLRDGNQVQLSIGEYKSLPLHHPMSYTVAFKRKQWMAGLHRHQAACLKPMSLLRPFGRSVFMGSVQIPDLPARELLPGDVVELYTGAKVPADIRIVALKTTTLRAEQASLTGESVAVLKRTEHVKDADCELQLKDCMLFAGTAISNGSCIGIVNDIGMVTEIGKIQQQIQEAAEEDDDSPLKKKLDSFGERLAQVRGCAPNWFFSHALTFLALFFPEHT